MLILKSDNEKQYPVLSEEAVQRSDDIAYVLVLQLSFARHLPRTSTTVRSSVASAAGERPPASQTAASTTRVMRRAAVTVVFVGGLATTLYRAAAAVMTSLGHIKPQDPLLLATSCLSVIAIIMPPPLIGVH